MVEKEIGEMTFKEFLEKARKEDIESKELEHELRSALREEGFTDEQIDNTKMEKVWKFFLAHISVLADESFTEIGMALKQKTMTPLQLKILNQFAKELIPELERKNKELERELRKKQEKKR